MAVALVAKEVNAVVIQADEHSDDGILDETPVHEGHQQQHDVQQVSVAVVHAGQEQQHRPHEPCRHGIEALTRQQVGFVVQAVPQAHSQRCHREHDGKPAHRPVVIAHEHPQAGETHVHFLIMAHLSRIDKDGCQQAASIGKRHDTRQPHHRHGQQNPQQAETLAQQVIYTDNRQDKHGLQLAGKRQSQHHEGTDKGVAAQQVERSQAASGIQRVALAPIGRIEHHCG